MWCRVFFSQYLLWHLLPLNSFFGYFAPFCVFLVAFFIKKISSGNVVFWAAVLAEMLVLTVFILTKVGIFKMGFLWLNPIGAFGVVFFSLLLQSRFIKKETPSVN